jgi:hypothetical protein
MWFIKKPFQYSSNLRKELVDDFPSTMIFFLSFTGSPMTKRLFPKTLYPGYPREVYLLHMPKPPKNNFARGSINLNIA